MPVKLRHLDLVLQPPMTSWTGQASLLGTQYLGLNLVSAAMAVEAHFFAPSGSEEQYWDCHNWLKTSSNRRSNRMRGRLKEASSLVWVKGHAGTVNCDWSTKWERSKWKTWLFCLWWHLYSWNSQGLQSQISTPALKKSSKEHCLSLRAWVVGRWRTLFFVETTGNKRKAFLYCSNEDLCVPGSLSSLFHFMARQKY